MSENKKSGDLNEVTQEVSSKLPSIGGFLESDSDKPSKKIYENLTSWTSQTLVDTF